MIVVVGYDVENGFANHAAVLGKVSESIVMVIVYHDISVFGANPQVPALVGVDRLDVFASEFLVCCAEAGYFQVVIGGVVVL